MLVVRSQSMDVYRNLAIEEYLMEQGSAWGPILFLWQSDCAVVMGKNQNPWKECRLDLMREEQVPLARRISGGGTVYHDAGNLNYCIIVDRRSYAEEDAYRLILKTLSDKFGISAQKTGKSNLSVNGLKFSGNAFCFRKGRAMHHGTLLLNADLERLGRYLGNMLDGVETHAIASVPADVGNLEIDRDSLIEVLVERFHAGYGGELLHYWSDDDVEQVALESALVKQRSDSWQFGATPRFSFKRGPLRLEVVKGVVKEAVGLPEASTFVGCPFAEIAFSFAC